VSRGVGSDAIRVIGWDNISNLPIFTNEHKVYRTEGWSERLVKRVNKIINEIRTMERCKRCGGIMVERINNKTKEKFMGCLNWRNH